MRALHVVFRVGETEYMLAASDVLQMESYAGATPVPGTPPYVAGIVHVRGQVVPVIDLRERFHLPRVEPTLGTRIVVAEALGRRVGLVVDSAREVLEVDLEDIKPPPRLVAEQAAGFVKGVVHVKKGSDRQPDRLLMLIDFAKVIGEEPLAS
jgi:purine-binding chemotaxis protein CheW